MGIDPSIPQGSMAMATPPSSSTPPPNTNNNESNDPQVDSALLSALRDKRERMALLRLEQTLIDFMNDRNCGYMEVGGHLNSIVKRGASGGGNGSNNNSSNNLAHLSSSDGSPNSKNNEWKDELDLANGRSNANNGMGIMNGYMNMNMTNSMPVPDVNNGNGPSPAMNGMRQTSFQRLCLHRLADRFNIVREQGYNVNMNNNAYNNYNNGNGYHNPGLIRLVKVKESRIPSIKLIDLEPSQYDPAVPQDRGVHGITDRLAGTNLQIGGGGVAIAGNIGNSSGKKSKKKEKVKIMKRSSNGSKNQDSEKEKSSNSKNRRNRKKLSEKEKAYAEARARIFNDAGNGAGNDSVSTPATSDRIDNSSEHSLLVPSQAIIADGESGGAHNSASTPQSQSPIPSQGSSPQQQQLGSDSAAMSTADAPIIKAEFKNQSNPKRGNLPAAATGGAASKVTWRNREQEASDPDFQRRHHPVIMQPIPVPVGVQGPYVGVHHQYNGMNVNHQVQHQGGYYVHTQGLSVDVGQQQMYGNHSGHAVPMYHAQAPGGHYYHQEVSPTSYNSGLHSRQQQQQRNNSNPLLHSSNHSYEIPKATESGVIPGGNSREKIDLSQDNFPSLG